MTQATQQAEDPREQKIVGALCRAWGRIGTIGEDAENDYFGSRYATLGSIMKIVRPVLAAEGLCVTQHEEYISLEAVRVVTKLWHESGVSITLGSLVLPVMADKKGNRSAHASVSAMSYARRVSIMLYFGIAPTRDEDDDGNAAVSEHSQADDGPFGPELSTKMLTAFADIGVDINEIKDWIAKHITADIPDNPAHWPHSWRVPLWEWMKEIKHRQQDVPDPGPADVDKDIP